LNILRGLRPKAARHESRGKARAGNVLALAPLLFSDYFYPLLSQAGEWLNAGIF